VAGTELFSNKLKAKDLKIRDSKKELPFLR